MLLSLLSTGIECGHEDGGVNIEGGMPPTVRGIQYLHGEEHRITCTIVVSHLKGTAIVYKPHVLRRCLSSQGTSMYPRVHEGCWATVASSQNCETISGHYKSYYGTSHQYRGFLRCMGFVPSCSCMSSLGRHTTALGYKSHTP